MNNDYERILLTCIYDKKIENGGKGITRIPIYTIDEYNEKFEYYNRKGGICELVGTDDCQVKPYFDLDPKGEFDCNKVNEVKNDINNIIKNYTGNEVEIYEQKRDIREENNVIKHSIRLYPAVRISYYNIPNLFKTIFDKYDFIDKSIYNRNRRLYCSNND